MSLVGLVAAAFVSSNARAADGEVDLTKLPFEQLVNTEIITATKLTKQVSQATSAVSVVTAADIKAYGYRTLADILSSMRGITTIPGAPIAGSYVLLSGRGFGIDQYEGRISLLIDGQLASDSIWGQSFFGEDGLLDVELIDRVEYIPGPGSVIYGNGAFLGVINVITKSGSDFDGAQVAQETGSNHWNRSRLTYGRKFDNGLNLLLSGSSFSNGGRNTVVDQATGNTDRVGFEQNHRLFVKASFEGFGLEAGWVARPVRALASGDQQRDENSFANVNYDTLLQPDLKLSVKGSFGDNRYDDVYPDGAGGYGFEYARARWYGVDAKVVSTAIDKHTIVMGAEHRQDYRQTMSLSYASNVYLDANRYNTGLYLYDDYELRDDLQLNYGFRYDFPSLGQETVSPRIGLIFKPRASSVIKLSSGVANRQPTTSQYYEAYAGNTDGGKQALAMGQAMRTERVLLNEVVWEEQLSAKTRLMSSIYRYRTDGLSFVHINPVTSDASINEGKIFTVGADVELEHNWDDGSRLKASYAWQDSRNKNRVWINNSPRDQAKLNFTKPLIGEKLRMGLDVIAIGRRQEMASPLMQSGGYSVTNLTFTSDQALPGWQASFSIRNVFNRSYSDVVTSDGRNVWLQLSRDFK